MSTHHSEAEMQRWEERHLGPVFQTKQRTSAATATLSRQHNGKNRLKIEVIYATINRGKTEYSSMQQHWRRGCLEWTVCQPIATLLHLCHAWCLRVEEETSGKPANPQQTGMFCWQEAKGLFAWENLTPGIPHPTRELIYLLKLAKHLCGSGKNIGGKAVGWEETTQHKKDEGVAEGWLSL